MMKLKIYLNTVSIKVLMISITRLELNFVQFLTKASSEMYSVHERNSST